MGRKRRIEYRSEVLGGETTEQCGDVVVTEREREREKVNGAGTCWFGSPCLCDTQ